MADTMLLQEECAASADVHRDFPLAEAQHPEPTDVALSRREGLVLLERLIEDADFRARYEQSPISALLELGIAAEQIARLPARCQASGSLASLDRLIETRKRLSEGAANEYLSMISPKAQLS